MAPIGLILLFLTGVGPLLAWRKSTLDQPARSVPVADAGGASSPAARSWRSASASGRRASASRCAAFVAGTIVQEFWRGANVRRRNTGTDLFTALVGLVGRNKRRYGGYIVHVGIVLIFLGFAGNGFKQRRAGAAEAGPGDDGRPLHDPQRRRQGERRRPEADDHRRTSRCSTTASRSTRMYPAKWVVPQARAGADDRGRDPPRRSREDLYVVLAGLRSRRRRSATLQIVVNPLVNWIWLGFGVMALGTGIALLPERTFAFALAKLPAEAAATTVALLLMRAAVGRHDAVGAAGMGGDANTRTSFYARTPFEKQMQHEIVCTCGACGHQTLAECRKDPCGTSHEMRGELAALIDQGKNHDEIIQAFIAKYGSEEMLGAPLDRASTAWPGCSRTWSARPARSAVGFAAVEVVAQARRRDRRRPRRSIPRSKSASTMSSETSTKQGPAEAGLRDRPRTDAACSPGSSSSSPRSAARRPSPSWPAARASPPSSCSAC